MNNKATIGTISWGTLRNQDLLGKFARELEWLTNATRTDAETKLIADADSVDPDTEEASEIVNELFDALNEHAPDGCYFGSTEGDGSDFGFWPINDDN